MTEKEHKNNMKYEILGRIISLLSANFIAIIVVLSVSVPLLVRGYLDATAFAAIITGGIFAHNITPNIAEYKSYTEKALGKQLERFDDKK